MNDDYLDLSVVIITLNEANNLKRCLAHLPKGCEVIILDSGSSDETESVTKSFGASFSFRKFDNYADQKNAAVALANRKWILSLDADEELSPELIESITVAVQKGAKQAVYKLTRRLVFLGRAMRFGKSKDYPLRLFVKEQATFEGSIHEKIVFSSDIPVLKLSGFAAHYSFENLDDYFKKFNSYSSEVAKKNLANGRSSGLFVFRVLRPWWEFFVRYFLRLGFLDGKEGYTYAFISSLYCYVKHEKLRELQRKQQNNKKIKSESR